MTDDVFMQTIEEGQKISQSKLWKLLEAYYIKLGPKAWAEHGTPSFGTSNPITAEQYALLTIAFFKDCLANPSLYPIDPSQPIYILDLGAGSGQFSCAFLKKILSLIKQNFESKLKICLVLADIVEENFDFWKNHPEFTSYFDSNLLDYAYYHHAFDNEPITLLNSQRTLSKETLSNPLIVICNYFFCTLPSDLFRLKEGELQQGFISSYARHPVGEADFAEDDHRLIKALNYTIDYKTVSKSPYEGLEQHILEKLVRTFSQEEEQVYFPFPVGGCQVLRYFQKLSSGRLFLILGDHGANTVADFKRYKDGWIASHDSLSIPVNFFAFANFAISQDGFNLITTEVDQKFIISVLNFRGPKERWKELQFVFNECIETFNVLDYSVLLEDLKSREDPPSVSLLLELIKLGRGSPLLVKSCHKELLATLPEMDETSKEKLRIYLRKISENYYFNPFQKAEFFFVLGELLFNLEDFAEAASNYRKGIEIVGSSPDMYRSLGACYLAMGKKDLALHYWENSKLK